MAPGRVLLAWRTNAGLSGLPFPLFLLRVADLEVRCGAKGLAEGASPCRYVRVEAGDEEPPAGEADDHHAGAVHGQSVSAAGAGPMPYFPVTSLPFSTGR